jgi:hypothetical protein
MKEIEFWTITALLVFGVLSILFDSTPGAVLTGLLLHSIFTGD